MQRPTPINTNRGVCLQDRHRVCNAGELDSIMPAIRLIAARDARKGQTRNRRELMQAIAHTWSRDMSFACHALYRQLWNVSRRAA